MKKLIYLALCLITLSCLSSCNKEEVDLQKSRQDDLRTVKFLASTQNEVEVETRTGVKLKMVHTWLKTNPLNVHLFEDNNNGTILEGEDVVINTEDPYELATFVAGFYNSIIINTATKAQKVYTYTGVVAQRNEEGKFFIPAVQHPQEDTWIDPDADFMIGKAFNQNSTLSEKPIEFTFKRPVAVSRLAITNVEGKFIKSVTITSDDELTGSVGYFDIDFDNCTADLTGGSNVLQIVFAENTKKSGTTYANFVSSLGKKHITKVEVETDEYIYTKVLDANQTFKQGTFLNIAMDMTLKEGVCTRVKISKQELKFEKNSETIYEDSYDLASEDPYVSPIVSGAAEGAEVTYASSNEEIATVAKGESGALIVTPLAVGEVEISATASAVEGFDETTIKYTLKLTNSSIPVDQILEFSQNEFEYTYCVDIFEKPTLEGAHTEVTYESSDPEIATVDAAGDVTFTGTKGGIVIITATAEAGEVGGTKYKEGSASYTIKVIVPSVAATYYKASVVEPGYDYIIVSEGKALANKEGAVAAEAVSVESDQITLEDASNMLWSAVEETSSDLLQYGAYHLTNGGKYLSRISGGGSTSNLEIHAATDDAIATMMKYTMWDNDAENFWNISIYNSSASKYYAYVSSNAWVINTTVPSVKVAFFTNRQPQALAFSGNTAEYDLGTSSYITALPTLQGAQTSVSYVSSNPEVATVNASTGEVTPLTKGTTTITAKAEGSAVYQAAEASYTLTVSNSAISSQKFYKVDEIESGKQYVVVSNDYAMQNTSGALSAYKVSPSDNVIEILGDDIESVLWSVTVNSDTQYGRYLISNGGKSIYVGGSTYSRTLEFGATGTADAKYYGWSYSDDEIMNGGSSQKRYLYYTTGSSKFTVSTSSGSTHKAAFYSDSKPLANRNLAFAESSVQKNIGDPAFTITLNGNTTGGVTYSSSVPTVATVNATTGEVAIVGEGTTTIKAECAETADYKAGEASFTLNVVDPSKVTTYTKVTTAPSDWSGTYLFVKESSNVALAYDKTGNAGFKTSVTINNGKIQSNDLDVYQITVSKSATVDGMYDVKTSNGQYIYWYNSSFLNSKNTQQSSGGSTNTYYCSFSLSNAGDVKMYSTRTGSGGSVNYITYDGSKFTFNTTTSNTIQLYKLDGGSTPTPPTPSTTVTYTKLASNSAIPNGTYIIVNNTDGYALKNATDAGTNNAQSVSPTSGVISGEQSGLEFTISAVDGGYTIKSGNQYMFASSNVNSTYIGYQTSENKFTLETKGTDLFCLKTDKGTTANQYLYKKSSDAFFKLGGSGDPDNAAGGVYLYKKSEE